MESSLDLWCKGSGGRQALKALPLFIHMHSSVLMSSHFAVAGYFAFPFQSKSDT